MSSEFSFLDYLTQQQPARLDALFESQWTCLATFRALPPLAKHYVNRLLFVDSVPLGERRSINSVSRRRWPAGRWGYRR